MDQDFKKAGVKKCYACIQWEGLRTYYPDKKQIKVAPSHEGNCLVQHKKFKGTHFCDNYEMLR